MEHTLKSETDVFAIQKKKKENIFMEIKSNEVYLKMQVDTGSEVRPIPKIFLRKMRKQKWDNCYLKLRQFDK